MKQKRSTVDPRTKHRQKNLHHMGWLVPQVQSHCTIGANSAYELVQNSDGAGVAVSQEKLALFSHCNNDTYIGNIPK